MSSRPGRPVAGFTSAWLAGVIAALIVYATLYPLGGWDHPAGWNAWRVVSLPWPRHWTAFDALTNVAGYAPLGATLLAALVRSGRQAPALAWVFTVLLATGLSLVLEVLQTWLPGRVPSAMDLACNAGGAALGALLGWALHASGWIDHWEQRQDRWIRPAHPGGCTLLLLWPLALLFPSPVPLGLGQVLDHLGEWVAQGVQGTALQAQVWLWLGATGAEPAGAVPARPPLSSRAEIGVVAASMIAPCMLAFTVGPPGWRRGVLALGAAALAVGVLTLSTALNFGPQHALAWRTPAAMAGIALGTLLACLLAGAPSRLAAGVGLLAIGAMVSGVSMAPGDPYFSVSLASWEQGRFIRFHGAAQWIGWIWPYATALYLLARLAQAPGRDRRAF